MNITNEQFETADQGNVVEIQREGREFILMSKEVYTKLSEGLFEELDPEVTYPAVLEAWDSVGSPDDATDYL